VKIRHYYFPRYQFNQPLQVTESQTTPGTTNLSGRCLTYQQALESGVCSDANNAAYGFIVDEYVGSGDSSTSSVQGIYFVGTGAVLALATGQTISLPVKYAVNGVLTDITDMSQVSFAVTNTTGNIGSFADSHSNVFTAGSNQAKGYISALVTNSVTGAVYEDSLVVEVGYTTP
jgi:hypothetical protein